MKKVMLLAILVLGCAGFAQENAYKSVSDFGKYINKNGDYLVLPEGVYPQDDFKDGYVVVRIKTEDHNSAVINHLGEIVRYPGDGIDLIQDGKVFAVKRNGLYGYINRSMELEITPQFDKAGDFVGQYAKVTKSGVECIINRAGEIVFSIEPYINMYGNQISISNPFDGVVILNHLYKLPDLVYQYISVEGEILTEPFEGDVTGFSEGYGVFMNGKFGKWIVIDKSGNVIEELPPADFYSTRREGLFIQLLGGEMRFVDERGSVVIEDQYTFVTPFFEGFAAVSKNERPINSTQRYFQYSNRRKEGLGSYQIINKDGVPINDFYYVGVPRFFQGGVAEVKILAEDGKMGYTALIDLNENGRIFDITEKRRLFGRPIIDDTTTRYSP